MEEEEGPGSLDLSHLSEEEQSSILQVLQRDLELRRRDEGRVRILQETETDPTRLRSMSGEWFSEARTKRHRSRMSAHELVHATIRQKKPNGNDVPLTELFNGKPGGSSHKNNASGNAGGLEDAAENGGDREDLKPTPTPSRKSTLIKEEDCDSQNGDEDSLSSYLTDTYTTSLKTSSSSTSLHSGYTLSGSMMSLFSSGVFGVVEVRGRIQFTLVYVSHIEELQVRVHRCEDISSACDNRTDPYVKTYLLPDKSSHSKRKTSVKKRTHNPVYDQTLKYKVRVGELKSRTLNMSVWHSEPLGRNVFLGEVEVSLGLWDWSCTQPLWQDLQPRFNLGPDTITSRGTIKLSIKFVPEGFEGGGLPLTGELHIWLREAQSLLSNKGNVLDSFIKSYILPDASRQSGQKTRVVKRSISPSYNHTMVYDGFQNDDLKEACAELTVWQREGLKTHMLGGIRLSCGGGESYGEAVSWMDSTEEEVTVWTSMIKNPNNWIEASLPIRTNLSRRCD